MLLAVHDPSLSAINMILRSTSHTRTAPRFNLIPFHKETDSNVGTPAVANYSQNDNDFIILITVNYVNILQSVPGSNLSGKLPSKMIKRN